MDKKRDIRFIKKKVLYLLIDFPFNTMTMTDSKLLLPLLFFPCPFTFPFDVDLRYR